MILYGYPGLMSADSADQLYEARSWDFGDWHPPLKPAPLFQAKKSQLQSAFTGR